MKPYCLTLISLLALFPAGDPAVTVRGLKVVSVVRLAGTGNTFTTTTYYQGQRVRKEWRDSALWDTRTDLHTYGPPRATIFQCDAHRVFELNLRSREYTSQELDEECRSKNTPPAPAPKGMLTVYIESTDTGERKQILGQTVRHIITHQRQVAGPNSCWRDGETEWDGWYVDGEPAAAGQLHQQHREANVLMTGANCRDTVVVHRTGLEQPGFPLQVVQTSRSSSPLADGTAKEYTTRWETEVTEMREGLLDDSLFQVPAGFTQTAKIDAPPEMPFSVATEYWWHRSINAVRSWFR